MRVNLDVLSVYSVSCLAFYHKFMFYLHIMRELFLLTLLLLLPGCRVHHNVCLDQHTVDIPHVYNSDGEEGVVTVGQWWEEFGVPELNEVVEHALTRNLTLKQSWWRVAQACWQTRVVGSQKFPEITTTPAIQHTRGSNLGSSVVTGADHYTQYLLFNSLNYEVDLWKRIDSEVKAACYEMQATREDLDAVAWTLAGTLVDLWFTIQEQQTLLDVIDHQIEVSRTQLELIELRYSVAQSSALDVYQQRLLLAQTEQQRTPVETLLKTSQNQLTVLLGMAPDDTVYAIKSGLVSLPAFPAIGNPAELLCARPDLKAQYRRLQSADYQVAAAVADRFPRLELALTYDWQSVNAVGFFNDQITRILGSLITPILDGGRRQAEVKRRNAIVCELLNGYGQLFLDALLEVEDALFQEKQQIKFLDQLSKELEIAKVNLEESNWHYINGLNDYLSVIIAIQAQQNLERRVVAEKKQLLSIRTKLYRSLGGPYLTQWCM